MPRALPTAAAATLLCALFSGCALPPAPAHLPRWHAPSLQPLAQDLLCAVEPHCDRYQLLLLDQAEPLAQLRLGYQVLLSRGMLLKLESEAELAFLIAHEVAHGTLGHRAPRDPAKRLSIELEADQAAAARLCAAGLSPGDGVALMRRLRAEAEASPADSVLRTLTLDEFTARIAAAAICTPRGLARGDRATQFQAALESERQREHVYPPAASDSAAGLR